MEKTKKFCVHCHQEFVCKRNPKQCYCAEHTCQNIRKREWRKQKLVRDPDYRQNQQRTNERWQRQHADYWRRYRETHQEYTDKNRQQQRIRDEKRAQIAREGNASHLAKSDALPVTKITQPIIKSGLYQLIPLMRRDLAKSDALTVELAVITGISAEFGSEVRSCKETTL